MPAWETGEGGARDKGCAAGMVGGVERQVVEDEVWCESDVPMGVLVKEAEVGMVAQVVGLWCSGAEVNHKKARDMLMRKYEMRGKTMAE